MHLNQIQKGQVFDLRAAGNFFVLLGFFKASKSAQLLQWWIKTNFWKILLVKQQYIGKIDNPFYLGQTTDG